MLLKIMGVEPIPDDDTRKTYHLLAEVSAVEFRRQGDIGMAKVSFFDSTTEFFEVPGNAYVYFDDGKDFTSWGSAPISETPIAG